MRWPRRPWFGGLSKLERFWCDLATHIPCFFFKPETGFENGWYLFFKSPTFFSDVLKQDIHSAHFLCGKLGGGGSIFSISSHQNWERCLKFSPAEISSWRPCTVKKPRWGHHVLLRVVAGSLSLDFPSDCCRSSQWLTRKLTEHQRYHWSFLLFFHESLV